MSRTANKEKETIVLPKPCKDEVEKYLEKWNFSEDLENYRLQESSLDKLFFELCPPNNKIEDILLKVAALNDFYSTNIFSVYPVAKHILSLNIDDLLKKGDESIVAKIQGVTIGNTEKQFYSFASKYCSHHNPKKFPIYDSYVDRVLRYFRNVDAFAKFQNEDLKNYSKFKSILIDFCKYYDLKSYSLKQIDQYLWLLGKEFFPKKYGKRK